MFGAAGKITGDIRISGHQKEQQSFARISGYVEQFDIHSPFTTVGEALWFSSRLRFEKSVDNETVKEFIEEVPFIRSTTFSERELHAGLWRLVVGRQRSHWLGSSVFELQSRAMCILQSRCLCLVEGRNSQRIPFQEP